MNSGYGIPIQRIPLSAQLLREQTNTAGRVVRVGLRLGDRDSLAVAHEALESCGYDDPEQARPDFDLPGERMLASPWPGDPDGKAVAECSPTEVLQQALVLGLCTAWQYDPSRPVLWTRASLARRLELLTVEGFY
jgi:hypothetical protein